MRRIRVAMAAAAALLSLSLPVSAATFYPSIPNVVDFGNVVIGTQKTILWEFSWSLDPGETTSWTALTDSYNRGEFRYQTTDHSCMNAGGICIFEFTYGPKDLGQDTLRRQIINMTNGQDYWIEMQGIGVAAPVPLPATAALLLAGLGGLGIAARRKRRQN